MDRHWTFRGREGLEVRVSERDIDGLEGRIHGALIRPRSPGYEEARRIWNGLIDRHPALIVRCGSEGDVATTVRFALDHGIELAVRGGGHNVAGRAISEGGLVVDLSPLRRVSVDARSRRALVAGGATLGDVNDATIPQRLAAPIGVVSDTGVAGLTLHGGYGWLSRRNGLALDNVLSARVVTADGRVHIASAEENPDLFWAIRGGGGNFGVVTSFEFRLHPVPDPVEFGLLIYPLDAAAQVLAAYRDHMPGAPDELGAIAVCWSAPPLPQLPEKLHGTPVLIVAAVWSGDPERADSALRPLRTAATPLADLTGPRSFADVQRFFDEDYPEGRLYYWKSIYLPDLPDPFLAREIEHAARRPSPLSSLDFWALGGAVARVPENATAFAHRSSPFLLGIEANWIDPARTNDNIEWARAAYRDAQTHGGGAVYLNFPGFVEEGEAQVRAAYGMNFERLRQAKARYDPHNLFRGNFNVRPSETEGRPAPPPAPPSGGTPSAAR